MTKQPVVMIIDEAEIRLSTVGGQDYISLTDIAQHFGGSQSIHRWLRNRNTIEFLGVWESIHNAQGFKGIEFDTFRQQAGLNSFSLTPRKWIKATAAIGLMSRAGRGGGTYAHKDIALEFGSWLSPTLRLLIIKEFQRLKVAEQTSIAWDARRYLAKLNYHLQTLAIKENIIPTSTLPTVKHGVHYASEAEVLNVLIFGLTSSEWRAKNSDLPGNVRDHATLEQLALLANLEYMNSALIDQGKAQQERLTILAQDVLRQQRALNRNHGEL